MQNFVKNGQMLDRQKTVKMGREKLKNVETGILLQKETYQGLTFYIVCVQRLCTTCTLVNTHTHTHTHKHTHTRTRTLISKF